MRKFLVLSKKKSHFPRKDAWIRAGTGRVIKREGKCGQKTLYIFGAAQVRFPPMPIPSFTDLDFAEVAQ